MITLRRLDLVRQDSLATADELQSLQTQVNNFIALHPSMAAKTYSTVGVAGTAAPLPANPAGYIEFTLRGRKFVLPFFEKA